MGGNILNQLKKWGGIPNLRDQEKKDIIKNIFCEKENIKLLRISYKENIKKKLNIKLCHIL